MSDPLFDAEDDAATPLTPDERAQLIPTYITTRAQLNEAEQIGIADWVDPDTGDLAEGTIPHLSEE